MTSESELLARLGLSDQDVRSMRYDVGEGDHTFESTRVLSAIARLRDEAAEAFRDGTAAGRVISRAKLADMGALLAMVLR